MSIVLFKFQHTRQIDIHQIIFKVNIVKFELFTEISIGEVVLHVAT